MTLWKGIGLSLINIITVFNTETLRGQILMSSCCDRL
jgi:hypothetical protein